MKKIEYYFFLNTRNFDTATEVRTQKKFELGFVKKIYPKKKNKKSKPKKIQKIQNPNPNSKSDFFLDF
jgi:hypothetical protein